MPSNKVLKPLRQLKFESIGEEFMYLYNSLRPKDIQNDSENNEEIPTIEELRQEYNLLINETQIKNKYSKASIYWSETQEKAIIDFIKEKNSIKRDQIFTKYLYKPFKKLIENIIFTYKLFRNDIDIVELQNDCMSFLITKITKFNPINGTKSFAYFGTIAKHYLMGEKKTIHKMMKSNIDIAENEDETDLDANDILSTVENEKHDQSLSIFNEIIKTLEDEMQNPKLLLNDRKVGEAIIYIFKNHELLDIYNKNLIYHLLKERTDLQTKEITYSLSRLKSFYRVFKENFLKRTT